MRVLIGVMYSGENEYADCLASIKRQRGVEYEIFALEHMPNKQAHDALYERFNSARAQYDLFLKMDADMVFMQDHSLASMVNLFASNPNLDHLKFDVLDWLSTIPIPCQNMYSRRVRWEGNTDELVVDYHGTYPGTSARIYDAPLTQHMPNPLPFQAFAFGVHRTLKLIQPRRGQHKEINRALLHWTIIDRIFSSYLWQPDVRRLYALAGVLAVLDASDPARFFDYRADWLELEFKQRWQPLCNEQRDTIIRPFAVPLLLQKRWLQRFSES